MQEFLNLNQHLQNELNMVKGKTLFYVMGFRYFIDLATFWLTVRNAWNIGDKNIIHVVWSNWSVFSSWLIYLST